MGEEGFEPSADVIGESLFVSFSNYKERLCTMDLVATVNSEFPIIYLILGYITTPFA
jgi:hypothetical protein